MSTPDQPNDTAKVASKKEQKRKEKKDAPANEDYAYTIIIAKDSTLAPHVTRALELFAGSEIFPKTRYAYALDGKKSFPSLILDPSFSNTITGDANIARHIVRNTPSLASLYGSQDSNLPAQIDQWLELYSFTTISSAYLTSLPEQLETYLATRTYLVGYSFTLADIAIYIALKKAAAPLGPHTERWATLVTSVLPDLNVAIPVTFVAQPGVSKANNKANASGKAEKTEKAATSATANADNSAVEDGGTCPPLENAVEGAVCTRFPPEPSGYLHIGHAKAVLLNQYYAQRYKGRLLVRFDDTNPSKEKEEFEENIIQDLATLGVKADKVSHSSDYFEVLENYARQLIKEGKAYMDDTDQETMQAERMKMLESKRRNTSVEENLEIFEALLKGETTARKFCLRAKIDMTSVNGTMRDPVLYRFNDTPHHRTGSKFKAYPTYDFACPVIDAIEGVTHALRTTEYNDRDEQYHWIQQAVGLRHVYIQAFGKMNFVNTVLSKRKLTWFVENKLVEGWFDPRFPTIQGCVRRGVNVDALKNFIISQGASRRVITMEWDKFWAENKKVLEERCPRYMGVSLADVVELTIENVADEVTLHTVQVHPQKPEHGTRVMRRAKKVLIDQVDALTYTLGEEITLLRWGNMKLTSIEKNADGSKVLSMRATYDETATNFSKTKKVTWLAVTSDNVPCKLVEFDHLISKAKLGDEEDFKDFVNPVTRSDSDGLADACLRLVKAGTVIQLERKGFYRVDKEYGGSPDKPAILFAIPDGKSKSLNAVKETAPATSSKSKAKK